VREREPRSRPLRDHRLRQLPDVKHPARGYGVQEPPKYRRTSNLSEIISEVSENLGNAI
jgi:hypothetical protein